MRFLRLDEFGQPHQWVRLSHFKITMWIDLADDSKGRGPYSSTSVDILAGGVEDAIARTYRWVGDAYPGYFIDHIDSVKEEAESILAAFLDPTDRGTNPSWGAGGIPLRTFIADFKEPVCKHVDWIVLAATDRFSCPMRKCAKCGEKQFIEEGIQGAVAGLRAELEQEKTSTSALLQTVTKRVKK